MNKKTLIVGILIGILLAVTAGAVWLTDRIYSETQANTATIAQIVSFINSQISASQKTTTP